MKTKIIIIIIGISILFGFKQQKENKYKLIDVQINKSESYLTLPKGIKINKVTELTEGFYQIFFYSDHSSVIILKGENTILELPTNDNPNAFARKEIIDGIQMVYGNVMTKRKAEFDKAFDLMKKNGIMKKLKPVPNKG
jgi:hypothetical protein